MDGTITQPLRHAPITRRYRPPRVPDAGPSMTEARLGRRLGQAIARAVETLSSIGDTPIEVKGIHCGRAGFTSGLELVLRAPAWGTTAVVVIEPGLLQDPTGSTSSPLVPIETGPDRLQRALFLHRLLDLLAQVHAMGGPRLCLSARDPRGEGVEAKAALILEFHCGTAAGAVEIGLGPSLLDRAAALPHTEPPSGDLLPALSLEAALELGTLRLLYRSLVRLRPGDLLLIPGAFSLEGPHLEGPAELRLGPDRVALGGLANHHFTIEALARARPIAEENPMSWTPDLPPASEAEPSAIDGVRVDLQLRLARLPLELEALAALEPGVILPVPGAQDQVVLHVADQVIGRGELVEFEGELAVRVTTRCR